MNNERQLQESIIKEKEKFIEDVIKPFYYNVYILDELRLNPTISYNEKTKQIEIFKNIDKIEFIGKEIQLNTKRCDLLFKISYTKYNDENIKITLCDYIIVELKNRFLEMNDIAQIAEYKNLLNEYKKEGNIFCVLLGTGISENLSYTMMSEFISDNLLISTFNFSLKYQINYNVSYNSDFLENLTFDSRLEDDNNGNL